MLQARLWEELCKIVKWGSKICRYQLKQIASDWERNMVDWIQGGS